MKLSNVPLRNGFFTILMLCGISMDASAANVAPKIAGLVNRTQPWNAPATPLTATGTVTDTDSLNFNTGKLTIKMVVATGTTVTATDKLSIRNQGTTAGLIGFTGVAPFTVTFGGVPIGKASAAAVTSTTNLVITFNSNSATPAAVQALLRNITYQSTSTSKTVIGKKTTIQCQVTDGDGGTSNMASEVITLVQASPVLGGLTDITSAFWNIPGILIDSNATVTDPDSIDFNTGILQAGMVTTATHTVTAKDKLSIRNQGTGAGQIGFTGVSPFTVTYGNVAIGKANAAFVTGLTPLKVTFNSGAATPAAVQALLRNLTYSDIEPAFTAGNRTVQLSVSDGDGGSSSVVKKTIHLGKIDGVYLGKFLGSFTVPIIGTQSIPGPLIPNGSNTIKTTINGTNVKVELGGFNAIANGTLANPTGVYSTTVQGTIPGFGNVSLKVTSTAMTLNSNDTVQASGTWQIVNTPGVTGSGTWTCNR